MKLRTGKLNQANLVALFATINGQPNLGRAIEILDEDLLPEFLEEH